MKALIQRVNYACVKVEGRIVGQIGRGLLIFLGIHEDDIQKQADYLVEKILNLRIFPNDNDKLDQSVLDVKGELLVVSQFTLYADCQRGRRPDFTQAAKPEIAQPLYEYFLKQMKQNGLIVASGEFQKTMKVELENDGPLTILIEK